MAAAARTLTMPFMSFITCHSCVPSSHLEIVLHAELHQPPVEDLRRLKPRRGCRLRRRGVGGTKEGSRAGVEHVVEVDVDLESLTAESENLAAAQIELADARRE